MSKFVLTIEHKPVIKLLPISAFDYRSKLNAAWHWDSIDLDDAWYFYPEWEDWDKILQYVQKHLPKYVPDKFDCDNCAFYISIMVSKEFGCNTCNVVEGYADFQDYRGKQRHKWNVIFDGLGFYQIESQKYQPPTNIADIDDPYYVPDEIIAF